MEDDILFDTFAVMTEAIQVYETMYGTMCRNDNTCLSDYNYRTPVITNRLRDILYQLRFQGQCLVAMTGLMH